MTGSISERESPVSHSQEMEVENIDPIVPNLEINENVPAFSEKKDVIHINQIQSQTTIYELI